MAKSPSLIERTRNPKCFNTTSRIPPQMVGDFGSGIFALRCCGLSLWLRPKQTKLAAMIVWPVDRGDILGGTVTLGIGWIARRNWLWSPSEITSRSIFSVVGEATDKACNIVRLKRNKSNA